MASLSDLSADIDALYQLPLAEFTAARNALANRVKADQGKPAAADIKALEKPSVSAWVVNQLYWKHRPEFDRLIRAGDELRAVQQRRLAGRDVDVNAAIDSRREALAALMQKADALLQEIGSGPDIRQRVQTTLEALSTYGTSDAAPRAGRLTTDVQPPGFAALATLVPAGLVSPAKSKPGVTNKPSVPPALRAVESRRAEPAGPAEKPSKRTEQEARRTDKARDALAQAESALTEARVAERKAAAAQTKAQAEWDAARVALEEIQRRLNEALDRERAAQIERDERRRAAAQATHAVGRAERARDEAERFLQLLQRE
jgi:hypothetical protein